MVLPKTAVLAVSVLWDAAPHKSGITSNNRPVSLRDQFFFIDLSLPPLVIPSSPKINIVISFVKEITILQLHAITMLYGEDL